MQIIVERLALLAEKIRIQTEIDSYRVFHGRGRTFPGLEFVTVDFFQPAILVTLFVEPPEQWLDELIVQIHPLFASSNSVLVVQHRYMPNAPSEIVWGELPDLIYARRGNSLFNLHLAQQQNSGFFLDMESGRQWIEQHAADKRVLNLFAYTCAFSVVAINAGAEKVVNVDMSSAALNLGRANHQLNNLAKSKSEFVAENILKSWSRVKKPGPYDLVIIDPPSYQKGSFIAEKDYAKVIRRLPELMPTGGLVLACLNAPELSEGFLKQQFVEQCPHTEFIERVRPHADFPDIDPEQQLKLLVYRVPPSAA
ncbi:class I SAM-dependent methyltransferase [Cellvibrio fibrivorans]|uniref:23S rRNA (Cytosine1962-C5)-methyltransferase n=1 Tax=Cellvibrio fibrivorans TaxID=126350 RepID=A0ABU1UYD5_9GAMM|nr:class I SAM-dependent methyltransferase [Cellvibrio fibrivorans]MDR7090158.1 23S rRNA (cytosine1962-C5)-methyltransferase [Cellvibrio fibrivorans]